MTNDVTLVGLDFGTTTSSAVVATARVARYGVTERRELTDFHEVFRSDMAFTPFDAADRIDEQRITKLIDDWLHAAKVQPDRIFGGGALLTGLTAQRGNADALVQLIRQRLGNTLIASADDPCLESWLAYMGTCTALPSCQSWSPFINLDIGGGTTNLAFGRLRKAVRTGCLFVGARHFQVVPGSYQLVRLSKYAQAILDHLGLTCAPGDTLAPAVVEQITDYSIRLLEATVLGTPEILAHPAAQFLTQVPFLNVPDAADFPITFSGGVGELLYAHAATGTWPATTAFGDLGIDLAQRISRSPLLSRHLNDWRPTSGGRATVYGLLRNASEVSGNTLYLPRTELLPLTDIPILGSLEQTSDPSEIRESLKLVARSSRGGCLRIALGSSNLTDVRTLGNRLADAVSQITWQPGQPLILLVQENVGKTLGNYVTRWGTLPVDVIVVDEVSDRDAHFVQIGLPHHDVVPVSYFGMYETGDAS